MLFQPGQLEKLCFSSFLSGWQMSPENPFRTSNGHHYSTGVDHPDMVFKASESLDRPTNTVPSHKEGVVSSSTRGCSPTEPKAPPHGMQGIRQQFIDCNIPGEITNVLMCSWRPGTQKQYDVHIRK